MITTTLTIPGFPGTESLNVIEHSVKRDQLLFTEDFHPRQDSVSFIVHNPSATLVNKILLATGPIALEMTYDGSPFFKGYLRDTTNVRVRTRIDQLQLQAEDYGKDLKKKAGFTARYASYKILDNTNKTNSIIHQLLYGAGFTDAQITTDNIDITVSNFVFVEDETTYWELIRDLLFNYGYVFYFDEAGVFNIYSFITDSITTTVAINNTNMQDQLSIRKRAEKYEGVEVEWWPEVVSNNEVVFSDTTGGDKDNKANISLAAGDYYPVGAGDNTTYCEYQVDDYEVILVTTPTLDAVYESGISLSTPLTNYYKMAEVVLQNTSGTAKSITKFDIVGNAILKGDRHRTIRENVSGTDELLKVRAEYLKTESQAQRLAVGLADLYFYSDFFYEFSSEEDWAIGTFATLTESLTGASTEVVIMSKKTITSGNGYILYKYQVLGISEYLVQNVITEQRRQSSNNSRLGHNVYDSNEDKPTYDEVIEDGFDAGAGTTTPSIPSTTVTGGNRRILIEWDDQALLTNFDHYEIQVSDDEISWYALRTDGTDWKGLADPEFTTLYNHWFIHENIPLLGTTTEPTSRTLYYRVRAVTKTGVKSGWSSSNGGAAAPYNGDDILANTIAGNKVIAGTITGDRLDVNTISADRLEVTAVSDAVNTINSSLTIDSDSGFTGWSGTPGSPNNGDTRSVQDGDEFKLQRYNGTSWSNLTRLYIDTVGVISTGTVSATTGSFTNVSASTQTITTSLTTNSGTTSTFNGTIIDKNGQEVLALQTQYREATKTYTTSSTDNDQTTSVTFSSAVKGIASIVTSDVSSSNLVEIDHGIKNIDISGSTVSVTTYTITGSTGLSRTVRIMVTAFI